MIPIKKTSQKRKAEVVERDMIPIKQTNPKVRFSYYKLLTEYFTEKMGEKNLSYYEFLSSKQSGIIHILKSVNEPDNWLPMTKLGISDLRMLLRNSLERTFP
ncbi:hypothetical protein F8M41_015242 [Gigaspora margarita]|uniref:Uncharacterized protein n=1 Tax=Gigaspora margarita TaxID=4874 RepID=A0A8H4ENL5_GIGMA|nr:hypothetical protein F8M41_015242 [Gigaspora margarita]